MNDPLDDLLLEAAPVTAAEGCVSEPPFDIGLIEEGPSSETEAHLAACEWCRQLVGEVAALQTERRGRGRRHRGWLAGGIAGTTALMAAAAAILLWMPPLPQYRADPVLGATGGTKAVATRFAPQDLLEWRIRPLEAQDEAMSARAFVLREGKLGHPFPLERRPNGVMVLRARAGDLFGAAAGEYTLVAGVARSEATLHLRGADWPPEGDAQWFEVKVHFLGGER